MLSRTLPHTSSLLWPDSTLWEDLKCWDRPSNQPPAPTGSESQPQPTNTSAGGRREGAHVMANSAAGQTARRGLALTPPLPHSSEDGLRARPAAWSREGKSLGGDNGSPGAPPNRRGPAPLQQAAGPPGSQGRPAPLTLVDLLMLQEMLLLHEALLALGAAVRPLARVDALVAHQVGRVAEALPTVTADEGASALPPGNVAGQRNQAVGREPLLDPVAATGPLLQVAALVGHQADPAAETPHTHLTLMQFCLLGLGLKPWPGPKALFWL